MLARSPRRSPCHRRHRLGRRRRCTQERARQVQDHDQEEGRHRGGPGRQGQDGVRREKPVRHQPGGHRAGRRRVAEGRGAAAAPEGLETSGPRTARSRLDAAVSIQDGKPKVRHVEGRQGGRSPGRERGPSGRTFASSAATANRPRSYRSRTGTSRWHCRRRSSRATRSRSR